MVSKLLVGVLQLPQGNFLNANAMHTIFDPVRKEGFSEVYQPGIAAKCNFNANAMRTTFNPVRRKKRAERPYLNPSIAAMRNSAAADQIGAR